MITDPKDKFIKEKPEMLAQYVKEYWSIQKVWQGKSEEKVSVGDAISRLNEILFHTNPAKSIAQKAARLLDEIIMDSKGPADE